MRLAKNHLDIGLFTNDIDSHTTFWEQDIGLTLDHKLELTQNITQHRYQAHGSVIKVNHSSQKLEKRAASGYTGLIICSGQGITWAGRAPGGENVRIVETGHAGIAGIGIKLTTENPDAMMEFYTEVMQFDKISSSVARCGDSLLFVEEGEPGTPSDDFVGPGFRYITLQIFDADRACSDIERRGGVIAKPPVNLGKVARYAFATDPDGNWIEISARASLTGIEPPSK